MFMKTNNKDIIAFGYVKKQDGTYTGICINMGLFGQGKTPEEALNKVLKAVASYVTYVFDTHPDKWEKFLNRPAPANYVEEYKRGMKEEYRRAIESLKKRTQSKETQPKQPYSSFIPVRTFAEEVSHAQA